MVINYFCTRAFVQTVSSSFHIFIILTPWQDVSKAAKLLKFTFSDQKLVLK